MSYGLFLLAAALTCVSARFTVPVPIHYEIEAQFQKQTGTKMRWDPTNYLTYLAAVYAQCSHLYSASALQTRGKIANATAYSNLQIYFDPSLLQSNLAVFAWDVVSDSNQDAGTVDRDLRKLFGKSNGAGALSNIGNIDSTLRTYDRFGCSIETTCRQQQQYVLTFVCVFGTSVAPFRQTSGGSSQTAQPAQPATTRPAPVTRPPATTRPRPTPRPTTTAARIAAAGITETYLDNGAEFYELVANDQNDPAPNYQLSDITSFEQKITSVGLCKYETDTEGYSADVLKAAGFDNDVQAILYGASTSTTLTSQDLLTTSLSDSTKTALRTALGTKLSLNDPTVLGESLACSFALCSEKLLVGCAIWGNPPDDENYGQN